MIATKTQTLFPPPTGFSFVQMFTPFPHPQLQRVILISLSQQFVSRKPFHGIWEVKTIFILNHYLPFSLLFFYEYTLGFSRG